MDDLNDIVKQMKECMKEYRESHQSVLDKHQHFIRIMESRMPLTHNIHSLGAIDPPLFVDVSSNKVKIEKAKKEKKDKLSQVIQSFAEGMPLQKPKLTRSKKMKDTITV
jgi:uncharacterized protein YdcH (DUF465 family)